MSLDNFKQREILFLLLYSFDMGKTNPDSEIIDLIAQECKVAASHVKNVMKRFEDIRPHIAACDEIISKSLTEYSLQRVFSTDRNILRLAVYELEFEKKLPCKIIFSEAKRLAKKFSMAESISFVQSVLGTIQAAHIEEHSEDPKLPMQESPCK
jgi:transcription antitermination protein NusB